MGGPACAGKLVLQLAVGIGLVDHYGNVGEYGQVLDQRAVGVIIGS